MKCVKIYVWCVGRREVHEKGQSVGESVWEG